jgi:predicted AAA+ superfamily ATPase
MLIMDFSRVLDLPALLKKKSFFLFGPRATGKTTLIKKKLANAYYIDLLRTDLYLRLSQHPEQLESMISFEKSKIIVIDEIQRIPPLLNEVHRLIEEKKIHFLLTGSSARRLRQRGVNLLAGRAWEAQLFPLTSQEIPHFNLDRYLHYGGLPAVYRSDDPLEELHAYIGTYLKEEIHAEALVRKLAAFSSYCHTAALTSGQMLNFTQIGSDTGLSPSTVREYYKLLEDTFMGFMLPAFTKTLKRKAVSTAKFYFFDIGVMHALMNLEALPPQSDLYGRAFEHFIALELRAYLSYRRKRLTLSYWRSQNGQEVDFVVGTAVAIEVKATTDVKDKHLKGLQALREEKICKHYYLVSQDTVQREDRTVKIWHWSHFLKKLWNDELF